MNAVLLHLPGKRIRYLHKSLAQENIRFRSRIWLPGRSLDESVFDYNLIIILCRGPENPGKELMPLLRKKHPKHPIVMLDEHEASAEAKKRSLELGADAYFGKPYSFRDVSMTWKNLCFEKESKCINKWMRAFDLYLDLERHFAKRHERVMPLRNKEFSLLEFFIMNRGKLLTRNSILEHVWDRNANYSSNTVDVHINRLRRKIDDPFREKLIHTVHCLGYIFEKRRSGAGKVKSNSQIQISNK